MLGMYVIDELYVTVFAVQLWPISQTAPAAEEPLKNRQRAA